jgi:hypothetical protein
MPKATPQSLTRSEQALIAETQPDRLAALDEDALLRLHARVRRARDKQVQLHRREVAAHISTAGARGAASVPPRRSASKAEVFEEALARVSTSVARAARASAAALRSERLVAARGTSARPEAIAADAEAMTTPRRPAVRRRAPVERKTVASSRAAGARRQAKRDAR